MKNKNERIVRNADTEYGVQLYGVRQRGGEMVGEMVEP